MLKYALWILYARSIGIIHALSYMLSKWISSWMGYDNRVLMMQK